MTKLRHPATFADAVTRVAGRIGWAAACEAVGKSDRAVRNWSDPDTGTVPSVEDALRLDAAYLAAGGGEPPLLAAYQLRLEALTAPPADVAQLAAAAMREAGEFAAAAVLAVQPGAAQALRADAIREGVQAADAITATVARLGAPAADTAGQET